MPNLELKQFARKEAMEKVNLDCDVLLSRSTKSFASTLANYVDSRFSMI